MYIDYHLQMEKGLHFESQHNTGYRPQTVMSELLEFRV